MFGNCTPTYADSIVLTLGQLGFSSFLVVVSATEKASKEVPIWQRLDGA
jgi:hypothetical protein